MVKNRRFCTAFILDNSFVIFMVLTFLSFRFETSEILRSIFWLVLIFLSYKKIHTHSTIDLLVVLYVIAAFLSLSGMIIRSYPISLFFRVFTYSYVPIIFYFLGSRSNEFYPKFYKQSSLAITAVFLIGFYLLITRPSWYLPKALEIANAAASYTEDSLQYARFASFLDSYHVSNLGVCAICMGFGLLRFSINENKIKKYFPYLIIAISVVAVLLSRQRAAMYIGAILLVYYILSEKHGLLIIPLLFGVIFIWFISADIVDDTIVSQISYRFSSQSSSSLFLSRTHQWIEAFNGFLKEPIFGLGVGSGGHVAIALDMHPSVADGSYFKILLEGGLISTIIFLSILISSLVKGFKQRTNLYVEFPLLVFFVCSLIGANVIDMPYIIMFMWYVIGRINRPAYIANNKKLNNPILNAKYEQS